MFGVVDSVENGKDSTAGIANCGCVSQSFIQSVTHSPIVCPSKLTDVLHLLPQHHLVEDLSASFADEPIQTINTIFPPFQVGPRRAYWYIRFVHVDGFVGEGLDIIS